MLKLCLYKWCHYFKMFPLMFWGRLMRNWQLSHFSSAFNWMKVIYTMLTLSKNSYLWALIGNIKKSLTSPKWWKVYFSRKSLKEISWYAVYVSPVMFGNTSGFAEVYTLLWLIAFYIRVLGMRKLCQLSWKKLST